MIPLPRIATILLGSLLSFDYVNVQMYYIYVDVQSLCVYKYIITYTGSCYTFCPVEFFSWSTINMSANIKCTLSYDISLWYSILGKFHNLFRLPPIAVNLRYNEIFSAINSAYINFLC